MRRETRRTMGVAGWGRAGLVLLLVAAGPGARDGGAQDWVDSRFPYLSGGANDFPTLAVRWQWTKPVDDYFAPYAYQGNISLDAGISLNDSYFLTAEFRAPGLKEDWRFVGYAGAVRESRFGFYGLGNQTTFDKDNVSDNSPFFYRVRRIRQRVQGLATRRLTGPLMISGGAGVEHSVFEALPGPSVFQAGFPNRVEDDDLTGRLALVLDTRDNDFNTTRGLLVESGIQLGTGGNGYRRYYADVRGFVPLREGTVLAARVAGSGLSGEPPIHARFELPVWERTLTVLGGEESHRAFESGRFAGEHLLLGNLELRHNVLDLATLGAVTAIGFVDAGRVFENEDFRLTTDGLKWGGGAGIAIRILRSTIFTFNFAWGDEGFDFSTSSGWMF